MFKNFYFISLFIAIFVAVFTLWVSPKFGLSPQAWKMLGMVVIMVSLWVLEALPLGIVALIPIVYAPLVGISDAKQVMSYYSSSVVFLTLGGFALGLAIQTTDLHRRIALFALSKVGHNPKRQLLAFMLVCASVSMWITNTATVVMLLPVVLSVITALGIGHHKSYAKALLIGLAYSASIGGIGTLVGSSTNFMFVGLMKSNADISVDFIDWFKIGFPLMVILLIIAYYTISFLFKLSDFKGTADFDFKEEYKKLGPATREQKMVTIIFLITASLWIFKQYINTYLHIPISDEITAMLALITLFVVPVNLAKKKFILNLPDIKRLEYNIIFLIGGGLALAGLVSKTGLDIWVVQRLDFLTGLSPFVILLCIVTLMVFLTEITSNVAITASMLPLFIAFALQYNINPLLLAMPLTMASSMAFMLPVATPPNAIVFSSGFINIKDLLRSGVYLNIIAIAIITLYFHYIVPYIISV